jgi:Tol biopolymer transport system component/DNA-binding winged helix-turn-helix (wHTH) protein
MEGVGMGLPGGKNGQIHFGPFELDPDAEQLRKRGVPLRLQPKQFILLLFLAQRAGVIVSRQEIRQRVWGDDTFVDFDRGINFCINQIRAALGDDADRPRYIETIPRRGYRFIANIEGNGKVEPDASNSSVSITPPSRDNESDKQQTPPPAPFLTKRKILVGSLGLLAAIVTVLLVVRLWQRGTRSGEANTGATSVRTFPLMTFPGQFLGIALSPDASQIAFTWNSPEFRKWNIYVQRIGGGRPLQITHTQGGMIALVDWSLDGRLLVFGRCREDNRGSLYTIPALGGPEQRVADVACYWGATGAVWTPDGQSLLFSDACAEGSSMGIVALTVATEKKRCLAAPNSNSDNFLSPMLSPDGKNVAFVKESTIRVRDLFIVPFQGGTPRRLTSEGRLLGQFVWAPDGKSVIFTSDREGVGGRRLWRVSIKGGPIEPENDALLAKIFPGQMPLSVLSRDRRSVAYVDYRFDNYSIRRARLAAPGGRVISEEAVLQQPAEMDGPRLSPDGTGIVLQTALSGARNIWTSDAAGHNTIQLTSFSGELVGTPRWSPDGKWIVFVRRPADRAQIFMIDAEGRNMHALTEGEHENDVPIWSRDGKGVYFASDRTGRYELWKQDLASSALTQVTKHGGFLGVESYDGRYLYYVKHFCAGIWRMPIEGGEEERIINLPEPWYLGYWDISESGVYFYDVAASPRPTIKYYDFKSRRITTVLEPEGQAKIWSSGISVSRDGRTLLYEMVHATSTLMVADEIR